MTVLAPVADRQDVLVDSDAIQGLEQEMGLFLRRARALSTAIGKEIHPELDPAAYPLLATIKRRPGIHASELADLIGIGRGTMSRQLARLERLGLLARDVDPADTRGQLLDLTPEGRRRLDEAHSARRACLRESLADWTDDELVSFTRQFRRLNDAVDERRRTGGQSPG